MIFGRGLSDIMQVISCHARLLIKIYFHEVFGFSPALLDIHTSYDASLSNDDFDVFHVELRSAHYTFHISDCGFNSFVIFSWLFGSDYPRKLQLDFSDDNFSSWSALLY